MVSERSWKMGGSQMFLKVGDRVKVEDLIQGIIVQSGNDACVAMAEAIAGTEEEFAREMTEKAREIGLTNSTFANSTGLDAPGHLMTVRDLALLTRRIVTGLPRIPQILLGARIRVCAASSSRTATRCCRPACRAWTG